jgi:penicillin amidase
VVLGAAISLVGVETGAVVDVEVVCEVVVEAPVPPQAANASASAGARLESLFAMDGTVGHGRANPSIAPNVPAVRWVKRVLVFLLILALAAVAYGVFTVRRSFPQVSGELAIAGITDRVEILRDELGVPHIYASNQHDLFFAQGYTHAQDRFWQMDFWRHIGAGRLAEMFGEDQVETDMFLRSLGFEGLAEQEWETSDSPVREILQAYADGVNAYLEERAAAAVSLEYAILPLQNSGYEIEPWSPTDTLMWPKVMSWDLGGNMLDEIERVVLGRYLTPEQVDQLFPPFPEDKPVIVEGGGNAKASVTVRIPDEAVPALARAGSLVSGVMEVTGGGFDGIGSNNWVIAGSRTTSGLPILANDTHLSIQMPSIWYENGLHCFTVSANCPFEVIGYSFAGTPTVVIGHNANHAWAVTNQAADTQDLFIEMVDPENPDRYQADGRWVEFVTRTETISVAGGDDVTFEVRSTRHGPVISGTYLEEDHFDDSSVVETPEPYVVALAWKTLEPSTIVEAFVGINTATTYAEFVEAVSLWDIAPQNLIYGDVEGNIAYHPTGAIPLRATGDGRLPVPGWTEDHEWIGTVPEEEKPVLFNPGEGYIETANQPIIRPGRTPFFSADGAYGYRAARIVEMIEASETHDVESIQRMQLDARDGGAAVVIPHLLAVPAEGDAVVEAVQERLQGWSSGANPLQASGRSVGAAVYMAVWRHLLANTFHDQVPEGYWPAGGDRWFQVMAGLLQNPDDPFWDDVTTPEIESRDMILAEAMRDGHGELTDLLGDDPGDWTWGKLHIARFENQTFGQSGIAPIEWLFNRTAPDRVGGSESLVNAVGWDTSVGYEVDWVPSQRMVVDLGDVEASRFVHTTGQSGHPFHPNYDSMIEMWVDGQYGAMPFARDRVEEVAVDTLTLVPATETD